MIILTVTNLSGLLKIFVVVIVISGIRNIIFCAPNFLVCSLQGNFKKYWNDTCRSFMG